MFHGERASVRSSVGRNINKEMTMRTAEVKKYLDSFGKDIKQQQAVFQSQVTAQKNAWHETGNKIQAAAAGFAAEHRKDIDAAVARMRADAAALDEKLQKLARAGTETWSALSSVLGETRAAFDRANQAAGDSFKRAIGSTS
jgi:CRISPR/Cas system-associated endonuclease Cas1